MSLGCAGGSCGACCDPVGLSGEVQAAIERATFWLDPAFIGPVPNIDPSVPFALEHWHPFQGPLTAHADETEHREYQCDRYNPDTRLCEAHDDRPPVCSRYPFHGPEGILDTGALYTQCSYWLDVPVTERPENVRPLIPISVVKH